MSTLIVSNIKATGETASRSVSGVAAAWVNFNGTGTVAIRDSVNVSSLTDNGTGDCSIHFTSVMGSTSYVAQAGNGEGVSGGDVFAVISLWDFSTSSLFRAIGYAGAFSTATDSLYGNYSIDGDLA